MTFGVPKKKYICKYCGHVSRRIDAHLNKHDERCDAGPNAPILTQKRAYKKKEPKLPTQTVDDVKVIRYSDYVEQLKTQNQQ